MMLASQPSMVLARLVLYVVGAIVRPLHGGDMDLLKEQDEAIRFAVEAFKHTADIYTAMSCTEPKEPREVVALSECEKLFAMQFVALIAMCAAQSYALCEAGDRRRIANRDN